MHRKKSQVKYIFVTGGVVSSLGKGITTASIALLLSRRGYKVRMQKLDPYLNVDPGTMSPFQHGEVYVTVDGAETDLDLGHYERFTDIPCQLESNYTTGRIYSSVIAREREGGYLGKTVQVIPHITNEIKSCINSLTADDETDIAIIEIGGTAGDIESLPFLEAIRQLRHEIGRDNGIFIHLTLVPYIKAAGELKTKPSQQSVGILREIGITPDLLICRADHKIKKEHKEKLALFCNVDKELVFEEQDVKHTIYEVPLELAKQDLDTYILELLNLHVCSLDIEDWKKMVASHISPKNGEVEIAVIGKYISLMDAYKSIYEALIHGGIANSVKVKVRQVEAENIEDQGVKKLLEGVDGILVPGGFGDRGIEGKISAVRYARENAIPYYGICLGMQCAVIEFARNVCKLAGANSKEFKNNAKDPVIHLMEKQKSVKNKGGTMRLGAYPCVIQKNTHSFDAYGGNKISERHRHRYEFNNFYKKKMQDKGLIFAGTSPDNTLIEIIEIKDHPWFVGCQFHPEFQSTPLNAHPLFAAFIKAAKSFQK